MRNLVSVRGVGLVLRVSGLLAYQVEPAEAGGAGELVLEEAAEVGAEVVLLGGGHLLEVDDEAGHGCGAAGGEGGEQAHLVAAAQRGLVAAYRAGQRARRLHVGRAHQLVEVQLAHTRAPALAQVRRERAAVELTHPVIRQLHARRAEDAHRRLQRVRVRADARRHLAPQLVQRVRRDAVVVFRLRAVAWPLRQMTHHAAVGRHRGHVRHVWERGHGGHRRGGQR